MKHVSVASFKQPRTSEPVLFNRPKVLSYFGMPRDFDREDLKDYE